MTAAAESSLRLSGMHCAACSGLIEAALLGVDGVERADVSAPTQTARVRWDPARTRVSALLDAVRAAGYDAAPDTATQARDMRRRESRSALWRLFVAAFCAMQVMMLATPAYVAGPGELAGDQKQLLDIASWLLTLPVMWFSAAPFFAGAWSSLKSRRVGMDVPVALGIGVAFVASSAAAFDPHGPLGSLVYFDSLTMFVALLLGGRYLEMRARHRAEAALEATTDRLPQAAWRIDDSGRVQAVAPSRLLAGDRVRVPVGEAFAADGMLLAGSTRADESLLTGESRPVPKSVGDGVIAGSVNLGSPVEMRVERVGADTRYEAIVALMRAARSERPALLAAADRWAGPFVWAVLVLAVIAAGVWSFIDPARAAWVAVSVLIVTCPCALSLAAPSALVAGAGAAGKLGLLMRRLDAMQPLARMSTLFIDKTGTLTDTRLRCVHTLPLIAAYETASQELQCVAASLAAWSKHPVAVALRESFSQQGSETTWVWRDMRESAGEGIEAVDVTGRRWRLGSARWVGSASAGAESEMDGADSMLARTWLGVDGIAVARFLFEERLRDDAIGAVRALQAGGVHVRMLSGDNAQRARRIAALLGVDSFDGGLTPADKLTALREAQQRGECVAMVGDGINDAPVLAQADISIAMGEGASIARMHADGVLVSNRLMAIAEARVLAQRVLRTVHVNLAWAAAYNAACVPLALAGWLSPWMAGAGMAASSLFVVLNSARLAR